MVQQYRTGEWDLASQCVVHIGIVLWYFGMSVGNAGHHSFFITSFTSLCLALLFFLTSGVHILSSTDLDIHTAQ